MKKCPICNVDLLATDYEGFRVMSCGDCGGHLVSLQRFGCIKRVNKKTQVELKGEATSQFKGSTECDIKCPRCHALMGKEVAALPYVEVHTDVCRHCDLVWLDGGELAMLQLGHEASTKFMDSTDIKPKVAATSTQARVMTKPRSRLAV